MRQGNLFVISGPSGVGKGTLVARLLDRVADAWLSVSATSREPRSNDIPGVTYHFVSKREFQRMADNGELLEWAIYGDNGYGTPRKPVEEHLAQGYQVVLEIEVQGAFQIKEKIPQAHLVFIEPPSIEELERRLRGRDTDTEEAIEKRLKTALDELARKDDYDYCLVNDDLDEATEQLVSYVNELADKKR